MCFLLPTWLNTNIAMVFKTTDLDIKAISWISLFRVAVLCQRWDKLLIITSHQNHIYVFLMHSIDRKIEIGVNLCPTPFNGIWIELKGSSISENTKMKLRNWFCFSSTNRIPLPYCCLSPLTFSTSRSRTRKHMKIRDPSQYKDGLKRYRAFHFKDKTVVKPSYYYNGIYSAHLYIETAPRIFVYLGNRGSFFYLTSLRKFSPDWLTPCGWDKMDPFYMRNFQIDFVLWISPYFDSKYWKLFHHWFR